MLDSPRLEIQDGVFSETMTSCDAIVLCYKSHNSVSILHALHANENQQ